MRGCEKFCPFLRVTQDMKLFWYPRINSLNTQYLFSTEEESRENEYKLDQTAFYTLGEPAVVMTTSQIPPALCRSSEAPKIKLPEREESRTRECGVQAGGNIRRTKGESPKLSLWKDIRTIGRHECGCGGHWPRPRKVLSPPPPPEGTTAALHQVWLVLFFGSPNIFDNSL